MQSSAPADAPSERCLLNGAPNAEPIMGAWDTFTVLAGLVASGAILVLLH